MRTLAAVAGAAVLAVGGYAVADQVGVAPLSATETTTVVAGEKGCNDWPGTFTDGECLAAGAIITSLKNLQPAKPFCVWKAANPGEWNRLSTYAATSTPATQIVTWQGGSILNELQAYFATGAPGFPLPLVPLPPNACGGKLVKPPVITGATPGQTDVTVTVTTTP